MSELSESEMNSLDLYLPVLSLAAFEFGFAAAGLGVEPFLFDSRRFSWASRALGFFVFGRG